MSEKSVSQKIARVFEIVDYFLLVPSLAGLLFGLMMVANPDSALYGLAICAVFTVGTILLVGYFKHSRGRLSEKATVALWVGTIIFNGLFLLPSLYFVFVDSLENEILISPVGLIMGWWTIAIGGSIIALSTYKTDQKYL